MKRTLLLLGAVSVVWLGLAPTSHAQIIVRAPFVRVFVGEDGAVGVRAPFVDFFAPPVGPGPVGPVYGPVYGPAYGPIYRPLYGAPLVTSPPPANVPPLPPAKEPFVAPAPQPVPPGAKENAPPQPIQPVQAPTLEAFSKSFQPRAGSYEVTILNPVTKQPTTVRFSLPEGTPRRVRVAGNEIEFIYTLRQFVRIEFDRDGAMVISR